MLLRLRSLLLQGQMFGNQLDYAPAGGLYITVPGARDRASESLGVRESSQGQQLGRFPLVFPANDEAYRSLQIWSPHSLRVILVHIHEPIAIDCHSYLGLSLRRAVKRSSMLIQKRTEIVKPMTDGRALPAKLYQCEISTHQIYYCTSLVDD